LASRDARRRRQHQYRREQRRRTAGNIEADGGDRAGHLLATYAWQRLHVHARQFLCVVEGLDIADCDRHGLFQLIAEASAGSGNFFFADLQRFDVGFIKLCAVFAQRRVAIGFDVIKNVRHRTGDAVGGRNRRAH